ERLSVIPIYKKGDSAETGAKPYKGYKGNSNYCYEIYMDEKGKWTGDLISTFTANSKEYRAFRKSNRFHKETFSGKKLIMRLMSNDTIAVGEGEGRELYRLQKLSDGQLAFAPLNEANVDARTRAKELRYLLKTPGS